MRHGLSEMKIGVNIVFRDEHVHSQTQDETENTMKPQTITGKLAMDPNKNMQDGVSFSV